MWVMSQLVIKLRFELSSCLAQMLLYISHHVLGPWVAASHLQESVTIFLLTFYLFSVGISSLPTSMLKWIKMSYICMKYILHFLEYYLILYIYFFIPFLKYIKSNKFPNMVSINWCSNSLEWTFIFCPTIVPTVSSLVLPLVEDLNVSNSAGPPLPQPPSSETYQRPRPSSGIFLLQDSRFQ